MATLLPVNLINVFIVHLDPIWCVILLCHYCEYRSWYKVDKSEAFYSWPGLNKGQ